MSKRPHNESSASSRDAANDQPDQADPTEITSDATIDVTPGSAGQTLAGASADRAESTASQSRSAPEKIGSDPNGAAGETAADLGATIDSPGGLPAHTDSEAIEEPLDQTVVVTPGQRPPSEEATGAGQAPTPVGEITGDPSTQHTVTRFLAEGGLGKVYVAQDGKLQREVVLKTLKADSGDNDEAHHRFVQEAQINSQLEHPNIIPIYQAGEGA
ncbi:MAG: protein kinase, partial [Planctomycetota bacterium]|nr:protein kinase [Planctomycetota bacterium]